MIPRVMTFAALAISAMVIAAYTFAPDPLARTTLAQASLTGVASVIDGDTIVIHNQRIRLHGIDAPESGQTCLRNATPYPCGQKAAFALADTIARRTISCRKRGTDRYGRIIATCRLGRTDLNAWMVRHGWAVAYRKYSHDHIDAENAARAARAGIWAGRFIEPARWRRGDRLTTAGKAKPDASSCRIKGNISANGRIYHIPGSRDYARTRINTSKGERWFCSQAQARRAGWRRPRR